MAWFEYLLILLFIAYTIFGFVFNHYKKKRGCSDCYSKNKCKH